ncbi:MAG: alcohol dehydrogenase catalytic domain-containing protein, partial [Propionibacteriaceae bacterium]|nr:alcohol dehydrogenase catalytic domain-containing protein [Propionibacteriaceae bacterium]
MTEPPTSPGAGSPTSTGDGPATSPEAEPATSPGAEPARSFAAEPPTSFAAIRFTAADEVLLDPAKPLPPLGPHSILLRIEACGICFSDTKLLHAFARHPRKSDVLAVVADAVGFAAGGFDPERPQSELLAQLAATAGYAPGAATVTPGHETVARIVAVGEAVRRHRVGERVSVQTDFRHLPTAASNAAFGYTMDGGLEEYTVVDERVVTEPGTGKRFLIPVSEGPTASQVALVEPWSCVETAYAWPERQGPEPGGRVLVVTDPGRVVEGLDELLAAVPAEVVSWPRQSGPGEETFPAGGFSDIVYFGADAATAEALGPLLAPRGLIALVTGGARFDRPVQVDAGRIHYDLIRYCGTTSTSAA